VLITKRDAVPALPPETILASVPLAVRLPRLVSSWLRSCGRRPKAECATANLSSLVLVCSS